ncbi:hypothetical protein TRICHSKD4_1599 [Roseibium sp. TrichSKD4]|nr:hypothetical protein TRICHSKD4_1599 [Roseibium sp. TrichSKD4]
MKTKYPRSEGNVLRYLGRQLDDIAAFVLNDRDLSQFLPPAK